MKTKDIQNYILITITGSLIVTRGLFFFNGLNSYLSLLDIIAFFLYMIFTLYNPKTVYYGVLLFFPSFAISYFVLSKPIVDLTLLSMLLTLAYLLRNKKSDINPLFLKNLGPIFLCYILLTFLSLFSVARTIYFNSDFTGDFLLLKTTYYLFTSTYCGIVFFLIYEKSALDYIRPAITISILCYMITASIGYLYTPSILEYVGNDAPYKSMFRYPGLSTSNFTGNVILLLYAIYTTISKRNNFFIDLTFISLLCILSQSRSVMLGGLIFLIFTILSKKRRILKLSNTGLNRFYSIVKVSISLVIILLLVAFFDQLFSQIFKQTYMRIFEGYRFTNITQRLELITNAYHISFKEVGNVLFGIGYIDREINPHNMILSSVLLFGWIGSLFLVTVLTKLFFHFPKIIFILLVAQVEILFFTGIYDFLFLIYLCALHNESSNQLRSSIPR